MIYKKYTRDGITVTLVFDSPYAKALGAVACVLFKDRIDIASKYGISNVALAHEWRHIVQRRKRGPILYQLWAINNLIKDKYKGSKTEVEANEYEDEKHLDFPSISSGVT